MDAYFLKTLKGDTNQAEKRDQIIKQIDDFLGQVTPEENWEAYEHDKSFVKNHSSFSGVN